MAKRANPYVEDFVQQSKIHVGLKQFNNNEERLKKVYEKTLELLFRGAKKSCIQDDTTNSTEISLCKKDKLKQLCISKDGTLLHSTVTLSEKQTKPCSCSSLAVEAQCAYCEAALCTSCIHSCLRCLRSYCSHCSLIGSEGSEICVSCYD